MATLPDNRSLGAARATQKRLSSTARGTRSNPPAPSSPPRRAAEEPAGQPVADTVRKAGWRGEYRGAGHSWTTTLPTPPTPPTPPALCGNPGAKTRHKSFRFLPADPAHLAKGVP